MMKFTPNEVMLKRRFLRVCNEEGGIWAIYFNGFRLNKLSILLSFVLHAVEIRMNCICIVEPIFIIVNT